MKKSPKRNQHRFSYKGRKYPVGKLILTVVQDYMHKHPRTTLEKLQEVFPRDLQNRFPVVAPLSVAKKASRLTKRFYLGENQILSTAEGKKVAITNYWGSTNEEKILNYLRKELHFPIRQVA